MERMLTGGYCLEQSRQAAVVRFGGPCRTLSTAALGGGLRQDLAAVFNANDCETAERFCQMRGATLAEHQAATAQLLGLDPERVTGLSTGANIDNMALRTVEGTGYCFHILATGGVEHNAMRAGDPASLDESGDGTVVAPSGTVNLLCLFDAALSEGCLARALITLTEAKAAAFQELLVSSRYSQGIATGSGTDGAVLVCRVEEGVRITEAGGHFRLGEQLARAAGEAVKEALYRQSGLCAQGQHNLIRRLERFGFTEEALYKAYCGAVPRPLERQRFRSVVGEMSADGFVVSVGGLYAHLLDQLLWGLLPPGEAADAGERLLELLDAHHAVPHRARITAAADRTGTVARMVAALRETVVAWIVCSELE